MNAMPDLFTSSVRVIVATTDLSPSTERAVEQAAVLAKKSGAELCLLHVFNDGVWATIKALYAAERWSQEELTLGGRHGICDTFVGGTALKVLDQASFPLMLVRRPASADFSTVVSGRPDSDWQARRHQAGETLARQRDVERACITPTATSSWCHEK